MRLSSIGIGLYTMLSCSHSLFGGRASFDVLVIDSETMKPIPNVKVEGSFLNYSRGWGIAAKDNDVDAWTDRHGLARLSGGTEKGIGGYRIYGTPNYYNAEWTEIRFREQPLLMLGTWIPRGIVSTARLDRVINPIPLYVKNALGKYREKSIDYHRIYKMDRDLSETNNVPVVRDALLAYDMVKGDWLPPHGNGETTDIQFLFNETVLGWKEGRGYDGVSVSKKYKMTMTISMLNAGNGLVEVPCSENAGIKLRIAPTDGYSPNRSRWIGWFGGGDGTKTDCDKNRCYAFRIRTKYDELGQVKSALYGKVYGDFDMNDIDGVRFLYYLNPTPNDRNLEWDMKTNLCSNPGDIGNPQP